MADLKDFFSQVGDDEAADVEFKTEEATEDVSETEGTPEEGDDALLGNDAEDGDGEASSRDAEDSASSDDSGDDVLVRKPRVEKRIDKLVGERNEARDIVVDLEKQLAVLEARQESWSEFYGNYDAPEHQLKYDASFMNQLETLIKSEDSDAMALAGRIQAALEKEGLSVSRDNTPSTPNTTSNPEPTSTALQERLVTKAASTTISNALPENVHPLFKSAFSQSVLDTVDVEDLVDMDGNDVMELAREFIAQNGYTKDDVYRQVAEKPSGSSVNKAGAPKSAAKATPAQAEKAQKEQSKSARERHGSFSNYEKHRTALLEDMFQE